MELPSKTVAAEFSHHTAALAFRKGLDRLTDMPRGVARLDRFDPPHKSVVSNFDKSLRLSGDLTDRIHATRIPVPAIYDQSHIDIDNIALFEGLGAWNPMANHVVDRRTDRFGVAPVVQGGGDGIVLCGECHDPLIEFLSRHSRDNMLDEHVQCLGSKVSGLSHASETVRPVKRDVRFFNAVCHVLEVRMQC